ncbi:MAG: glutamate--tRNA ligase [Planctomycetota bacterium]
MRFAPSPTGFMHIGNARTALFNWMCARKADGTFVLRIEDTDPRRSSSAYEEALLEDLRWLGLDWDEGPDVGGPYGPYRQSERLELYVQHARKLLAKGQAYPCYCSHEELKERRELALARNEPPRYDNRCRRLSDAQRQQFEAEGRKPVLRFAVDKREIVVDDLVRGRCRFDGRLLGDFIILKVDGRPTYHFAVVVDDALMAITHVIRGEGHLPNTPLHVLLFEALEKPLPMFAHMSHTVSDSGKLSKRSGALSIRLQREEGLLAEAVTNYIALLGWSPKRRTETFHIREVVSDFDLADLSRASARHDPDKMRFLAGWHLRETDPARLARLAEPFLAQAGLAGIGEEKLHAGILAVRMKAHTLKELAQLAAGLLGEIVLTEDARLALAEDTSQRVLRAVLEEVEASAKFGAALFAELMKSVGKRLGVKGRALYHPVRLALTGREEGPELALLAHAHGRREVAQRLRNAIM